MSETVEPSVKDLPRRGRNGSSERKCIWHLNYSSGQLPHCMEVNRLAVRAANASEAHKFYQVHCKAYCFSSRPRTLAALEGASPSLGTKMRRSTFPLRQASR